MKISISGGGHAEFRVSCMNREDLLVSSALTGVEAVEKVAQWLAERPTILFPPEEQAATARAHEEGDVMEATAIAEAQVMAPKKVKRGGEQ